MCKPFPFLVDTHAAYTCRNMCGSVGATWSSPVPEVAAVTPEGFLTARSLGTTILEARTSYGTRLQSIRVTLPATSISNSFDGVTR